MEKIEVPSYLKFTNRDIKELLVKNVGVFRCFPRTDLVIMNAIFPLQSIFPPISICLVDSVLFMEYLIGMVGF